MKIDFSPLTQSASLRFLFLIFSCYRNSLIFQLKNCLQISLKKKLSYSDDSIKCLLNENFQVFGIKKFSHCWRLNKKKNKKEVTQYQHKNCLPYISGDVVARILLFGKKFESIYVRTHTYQVRLACI